MLRYFCLLSLLICINFSFCEEYYSDKDSNRRSIIRRLQNNHRHKSENFHKKKHHKRHDYDMYDKDPVAQIDVASFINSAEDDSGDENDPYNLEHKKEQKHNNIYGSFMNEISNNDEDYLDADSESSHYLNLMAPSEENTATNKLSHGFDKVLRDNLDDNLINHSNRQRKQKKCVLKNIKLPFFSHNKSANAKTKSDKKRKIYGFHNTKNAKAKNLSSHDHSRDNLNLHNRDKIKKRSYIERLCPACRKRFVLSKSLKLRKKNDDILKNPYYDIRQDNVENKENGKIHVNNAIIPTSKEEVPFESYWIDRRKKREDDDRNIERQKELEYLEKRVESVTIDNPSYNKVSL